MTGMKEDTLLSDPNPEDIIMKEGHIEGKTIILIEVTADSPDLEALPDPLS